MKRTRNITSPREPGGKTCAAEMRDVCAVRGESVAGSEISDEFVRLTIDLWRRKTGREMSRDEAIDAIRNAAAFVRLLAQLRDEQSGERAGSASTSGGNRGTVNP